MEYICGLFVHRAAFIGLHLQANASYRGNINLCSSQLSTYDWVCIIEYVYVTHV